MRLIFFCIGACLVHVIQARYGRQMIQRNASDTRTSACESNSDTKKIYTGYFNVSSFVEDYKEGKSFNFQMCPEGVFDEPLVLPASSQQERVTIACVDPNAVCLWKIDEGSHLNLEDQDSFSFIVEGVSFQGATDSSIRIKPSSGESLISFKSCDWSENNGYAVIHGVEDYSAFNFTDILSNVGGTIGGAISEQETTTDTTSSVNDNTTYTLGGDIVQDSQSTPLGSQKRSDSKPSDNNPITSTKIELENCSFHRNVVNRSVIFIGSIDIDMRDCDFVGNEVTDSLIHIKDEGLHDISDVRFKDNRLLGAVPGIIYVSASSRFNSRDICGSNNQILQSEICNGTAQQVPNTEECSALDDFGCTTECSPYDNCDECVASNEELPTFLEGGGDIKLCESTVFDIDLLNEPLTIGEAAISLGCKFNCTIKGGNQQLRILDGATDVLIDGINFESSRDLSIKVEIDHTEPADVRIRNCQFKGHTGNSIIKLSSPGLAGSTDEPIEAKIDIQSSSLVNNAGQIYMIENQGLDLSINSCKFLGNDNSGIIGASGGNTAIRDSQSWGNKLMQGLFHVSGDSTTYNVEGICSVNDSFQEACNGTYYSTCDDNNFDSGACSGSCEPLIENSCSIPDCLSAYEELQIAMVLTPGDTYVICPDTTINLDVDDEGFAITEPSTKIKCGENGLQEDRCIIKGGSYHLMINTTDVGVYGMTFVDALTTSIEIIANTDNTSSISFNDCSWEKNSGLTTVSITGARLDEDSEQNLAAVIVSNSTFFMNNAERSIISNAGSPLTISKSVFTKNSALNGSLVHIDANTATISDVQFVDNAIGEGIFFVSSDADLTETGICGFDNEVMINSCDGIAKPVDSSLCKDHECKVNCSSLMPCQTPSCFDDWKELTERMDKSVGGESFVLCPDSRLLLGNDDSPLRISEDDIVLRCGSDGKLGNQCLIIGGEVQVLIDGTATGTHFEGVTFSSSKNISIAAFGGSKASATFDGCEFSSHSGDVVIAIIHNDKGTEALQEGMVIEKPMDIAMEVTINSCNFIGNVVDFSPVVNIGGQVKVNKTTFSNNNGSRGSGVITSFFDSSLSVVSSCFLENRGNSSGAISLMHYKVDTFFQENNFGEGNSVSVGNCINVGFADPSGALISCDVFDSLECLALSLDLLENQNSSPGATSPTAPQLIIVHAPSATPSVSKPICYDEDNWNHFFTHVRDSMSDEVFTLCEGLSIDMNDMESKGLAPLIIQESGVIIECAVPGTCLLSGGSSHIALSGSVQDVAIKGLTMMHATESSIVGNLERPSSAQFELCDWRANKGTAVVSIVTEESNRRMTNRNSEHENLLTWRSCNFKENIASDAIIEGREISLALDTVIFERNTMKNVVDVNDGFLFLVDSCFIDSDTTSALINTASSNAVIDNIYLSESNNSDCLGVLNEDGDCNSLTSTSSCIAEKKRCIFRWNDLAVAVNKISTDDEAHIFTLCSNAVLDASNSGPIVVNKSNIIFRCGGNGASDGNCVVKGGTIQFRIMNTKDVLFSGITFSEASVAAIHAAGDRSARASIVDCVFKDIKGAHAALLIYLGEIPPIQRTRRRLSIADFAEEDDRSMTVEVSYSLFSVNEVNLAPIVNLKGSLDVFSCEFNLNNGTTIAGGITEWFSNSMTIKKSCFTNNYGALAGSIYVNGSSTTEMENFSEGNEASDQRCNDGLFLTGASQYDGGPEGLCVPIFSSKCGAERAPTVSPTAAPALPDRPARPNRQCIKSWSALNASIADDLTEGIHNAFLLCPGVEFLAGEDAIVLNTTTKGTKITISCSSELGDKCLIKGGRRHFYIKGRDIKVAFRGIRFEESEEVSILAAADGKSSLMFKECEWTGNEGASAVLIYHEILGDTYRVGSIISSLPYPGKSMGVNFDSCLFSSNKVTTGVVVNIGGTVTMTASAFKLNQDTSVGCIQCKGEDSRLELRDNCFLDNHSIQPGTIHLIDGAEMSVNEYNYGYDNKVTTSLPTCTDIFSLTPGEDCDSLACPGTCSIFHAQRCSIPGLDPLESNCYGDWTSLRNGILSPNDSEDSFTICNGATLDVDDTAIAVSGNVKIHCGAPRNTASAPCVIKGGRSHFLLEGYVLLVGLTFEAAEFASIVATGPSSTVATFQECTWRKHFGQAIMVMHSGEDEFTDLLATPPPSYEESAMTVLMEECLLENNDVTFAAIANFGGTLNLIQSVLHNNIGLGMIVAANHALLGLSETCLIQNSAQNRIIFVDLTSTLTLNDNNFGADNQAVSEGCHGIFLSGVANCMGLDDCEGECETFESQACPVSYGDPAAATNTDEAPTEGMSIVTMVGIISVSIVSLFCLLVLVLYSLKKRKKRKTKKDARSIAKTEGTSEDDEISILSR